MIFRNFQRKSRAFRIGISLMTAVSLMGCTSQDMGQVADSGQLVFEEKNTTVDFSWWGTDERHKDYLEGLEKFKKLNPTIDVDVSYGVWDGFEKRNRIAMASKTAADVMLINYAWLDEYSKDGNGYYDLNRLSDQIDLSQFTDEDLEYGSRNGKLNAIPLAYNTTVFLYNTDIYDQYDLDLPETWDDLFAAAKIMRKDGIYPIGMVKKQFFISMIAYYEQVSGKKAFANCGRLNINVDGIKDMLLFYKKMVDEKVIVPIGQFDTNSFTKGQTAGIACWVNDGVKYGKYLAENEQDARCGKFMTIDGKNYSGWYKKPATLYAMSSRTTHPEEAAKLMDYLLNNEDFAKIQGIEKGFPVSSIANKAVKEYCDIPEFAIEANDIISSEKYNLDIMPAEIENSEIIDAFKNGSDKYIYGEADLNTCAAEIIKAIREANSIY